MFDLHGDAKPVASSLDDFDDLELGNIVHNVGLVIRIWMKGGVCGWRHHVRTRDLHKRLSTVSRNKRASYRRARAETPSP